MVGKKISMLDYLEQTEERFGNRTAVEDGNLSLTWHDLAETARRIGAGISYETEERRPVPVMMEKSPMTLAVMFGALYAGCFYVPVNTVNPKERLRKILDKLEPDIIVTDEKGKKRLETMEGVNVRCVLPEELREGAVSGDRLFGERLSEIRKRRSEKDILYGIFTSGSTGAPKAIAVSHRAAIDFIGHFTEIFHITEEDIIGNQAPFDFDVSVKDIYSAVTTGAKLVLIPKEYFSTPPRLLDYLCDKRVTTLTWAVSALTLVSSLKGLDYRVPERVDKVMFSGEAMPPKQLRLWQEKLPGAKFVNLYGPTEITCNCTYFPVERQYGDKERIPAGKAFPGRRVFLLDADGRQIAEPEVRDGGGRQSEKTYPQGEICVAGESLAEGYYRDREQTEARFIQYPVDGGAPRRVYKTGDLAYYDGQGNLIFAGRKDFQIKHMGHRIELEEIEGAMTAAAGVMKSCCVFLPEKNRIYGFYMGEPESAELKKRLKETLPAYMVPSKLVKVPAMPLNKNGKTDRNYFRTLAETQ